MQICTHDGHKLRLDALSERFESNLKSFYNADWLSEQKIRKGKDCGLAGSETR
jgi:hypothetical protein